MTQTEVKLKRFRALSGLGAAAALCAGAAALCANPATAQGRNSGHDSGRGGESSPQRSEPRREESPQRSEPRREEPRREEPRRETPRYEAPRYEPQRREEPRPDFQRRSDPSVSRQSTPMPSRDPGRPTFGDDRRSGREAGSIPRQDPSVRREEPRTPPRDSYQAPRTGGSSSPARDGGWRNGDQRPQRDSGTSGSGTGNTYDRRNSSDRYDRVGDRRPSDQGPLRDSAGSRTGGTDRIRSGDLGYRDHARSESLAPQRDRARDLFTRSQEGRYYNNGVLLRRGYYSPYREIGHYYPGYVFYPYYYPTYDASVVYLSPYSFYFGVCAPYIYRRHTFYSCPSTIWIDVPVYVNDEYHGWDDDRRSGDDYYLNRSGYYDPDAVSDPTLRDAVDDIRDAFRYGSIEHLVNLVDPQIKIAVFLKGKYDYSMATNDYLDLTRDAMRNMDTIEFDITRLRKRAMGVYVASGKHVYRDSEGRERTVYVSFVLEKLRDHWTITQVGTSPDRIQEP
jgi:hypothetical protein